MGLYDRDYGRDERTPWDRIENPRSITITLIVINVIAFFASMLIGENYAKWFGVGADTLVRPWMWWQFLTYGFVHDLKGIFHIAFNMIGLFFFGRILEQKLGRMEFLRFYLVAIVIGGIVGALLSFLHGMATGVGMGELDTLGVTIGASGAVVAGVILFACLYPEQKILLMFVIPVKAKIAAALFVAIDLAGALGFMANMGSYSNTAFTVHLAGAAFALAYYFRQWNLRWLDIGAISDWPAAMRNRSRRMKLKLHDPDKKIQAEAEDADRILAKIHATGESSLTSAERKTLERYSRRQRERRDQH